MKILRMVFAGLVGLTLAAAAQASTEVSVRFDINSAPPPRMVFHDEPHMVYVPDEQVYVVDDPAEGNYDCFRYGGYWYAFNGGSWYRAPRWNAAFVVIHPARVPVEIYHVPPGRWKHRAVWADERREMHNEYKHEKHEEKRERHEDRRDDRGDHGDHGDHGHHGRGDR